jgi:transposase
MDNTKKFRGGLDPAQTLILPFSLDAWLRPDHPVRGLADIIDQLDLSAIYATYSELRGQPPYDPRMMVRIIAYGYSKGLRSSRRIEQALHDDIAMRWLSRNQQPDHSVIAEFRRRHHKALGDLLVQTVQIAKSAGLVGGHDVAVDGTKFQANASKHSAMSHGYMEEEKKRLEEAVAKALAEMEAADQRDEREGDSARADALAADVKFKQARLAKIREAMAALEQRAKESAEAKEAKRKAVAEREGKAFVPKDLSQVSVDEKAQYNFTDPQSRILRGKNDDYIQGYNGQVAVDAESMIAVAAELTIDSTDYGALVPVVDQAANNLGEKVPGVLADAGYFSAENVGAMEERGIDALIPPRRISHTEWRDQPLAEGAPPDDADAKDAMRHRIRTPEGRARYKRRQETVEPAFGNLKEVQGQRQELLRGYAKSRSMWRFQWAVFNLKKLVKAGVSAAARMRGPEGGYTLTAPA